MEQCPNYNGIHLPQEFSFRELEYIKYIIRNYDCLELFDRKYIMCIIGSPSENATVYKGIYNDLPVAVKVPHQSANDNIDNEINVNLQLESDDNLFLRMYGFRECRVAGRDVYTYLTKVMFMELAIGDLLQYLFSRVTLEKLNELIIDVFNSVARLAEIKVKHNDLHIKNIFIVKRFNKDTAVIGDFGKAIPQQYLVSPMDDIYTFLSSLNKYLIQLGYAQKLIDLIIFYIRNLWAPFRSKYEYTTGWSGEDSENLIIKLRDDWTHLVFKELFFTESMIIDS